MEVCAKWQWGATPLEIATSISPRLAAVVVVAKVRPLAGLDINESEGGQDDAPPSDSELSPFDSQAAETMYGAGDPQAEKIVDLSMPLTEDVELWLLKEQDEAALKVVRHSARARDGDGDSGAVSRDQAGAWAGDRAGLLLRCVSRDAVSDGDLVAIEKRMAEVVARDEAFVREMEPRETASPTMSSRASS